MVSILALSVTDEIEKYGAYAGLASVLGLAVLSLLYFAQAREVKRLREWAGRAPERSADLQDRVQVDAQRRTATPPPPVRPLTPGVPVTPAGQAPVTPAAAAAATAAGAAATAAASAPPAPGAQPTTVQPAANGAPPVAPKPGEPLRMPEAAPVPVRVAAAAAAAPPSRTVPPGVPSSDDDGGGGRSPLAIVGALAGVLVIGVVAAVLFLGGGDDSTPPNRIVTTVADATAEETGTTTTRQPTAAATLRPGTYVVSVLNGTAVPGLARGVANRLTSAGWKKIGNVTNAADQTRSGTLVEYTGGHRREALAVAKAIDVGTDAVQAISPGSRAIAGEDAIVVVTVGQDQNVTPQQ